MKIKSTIAKLPYQRASIGSLLSLGALVNANAAITQSTTIPNGGRPPADNNSGLSWDVDGDSTADFLLGNSNGGAFFDDLAGGRVFAKTTDLVDPFVKINSGQSIGNGVTGYGFATGAQGSVTVTVFSNIASDASQGGWSLGQTGFIGFKFTSNGGVDTHFGWANITVDGLTAGQGYIINDAWYESAPGVNIQAGQIPETSTYALGLGALALGAAGIRRWRKSKLA